MSIISSSHGMPTQKKKNAFADSPLYKQKIITLRITNNKNRGFEASCEANEKHDSNYI